MTLRLMYACLVPLHWLPSFMLLAPVLQQIRLCFDIKSLRLGREQCLAWGIDPRHPLVIDLKFGAYYLVQRLPLLQHACAWT